MGRLASELEARFIALAEKIAVAAVQIFSTGECTLQRLADEMPFRWTGEVVVPDVTEGVVEADAFEAVIEANGPMLLGGEGGKGDFGEVFEALDLRLFLGGSEWRRDGHGG